MTNKKPKEETDNMPRPEEMVCVSSPDKEEMVCSPGGAARKVEAVETAETAEAPRTEQKKSELSVGAANILIAPYRLLAGGYARLFGWLKKLLILDFILLGIVCFLLGFNVYLFLNRPEVFSGAPLPGSGNGAAKKESPAFLPSEFLAQIKINGQEKLTVNPGDDLQYVISYRNDSQKEIFDVAIKINLTGAIFDFERADFGGGVFRQGGVVWTKDQISDFIAMPVGANGELKFKIGTTKIVEPAKVLKFGNVLKSQVEVSVKEKSNFGESSRFIAAETENKINSDLAAQVLARYFTPDGDQLGRGPLPPKAGVATKYWIFLSAENNLNNVSDVFVSAILPQNVEWTGNKSVSLGELSYNETKRNVAWKVGEVGRYTGEEWSKQGAAFEVALTPDAEQIGQAALLFDKIKIFGTDKFTGQFLERTAPDVTTDLVYDGLAKGKGKVVE